MWVDNLGILDIEKRKIAPEPDWLNEKAREKVPIKVLAKDEEKRLGCQIINNEGCLRSDGFA